jgi:hypothetical protein
VIHAERVEGENSPGDNSVRVPVTVRIGKRRFGGGLLLRHTPPPYVSLSPDLIDPASDEETTLATVLKAERIDKNQVVLLSISEIEVNVTPFPDAD